MPTTKTKIAEQVSRIYTRYVDRENIRPVANVEEMKLLVEQSINAILKAQLQPAGKYGGYEIPAASILTYSAQTVTAAGGIAYVTLPAFPLDLPNDMGVWEVSRSDTKEPYIPIPRQVFRISKSTIIESMEQLIGWFRHGDRIEFTKDITSAANGSVTEVDILLMVSDLSQFGDNVPLPISAEQERAVILACLETLGAGRIGQAELAANQKTDEVER